MSYAIPQFAIPGLMPVKAERAAARISACPDGSLDFILDTRSEENTAPNVSWTLRYRDNSILLSSSTGLYVTYSNSGGYLSTKLVLPPGTIPPGTFILTTTVDKKQSNYFITRTALF